jgi:cytochrome P450
VWAVLKNPELQDMLENEIAQMSDDLNLAELEAAPILNSVINETFRLYSAAPSSLPRVVPSQGMEVGGYHIPGGVEVSTQAYTTHRDPSVWSDPLR